MAHVNSNDWASDTKVSMPVPPKDEVLVDFGGFGFTQYGIVHNISQTTRDEYLHPTFSPPPGVTDA